MPIIELYLAEDGSFFKKNPMSQTDATFCTFSRLTDEELRHVSDSLCTKKIKRKSKAGTFREEPTLDDDARNQHEDRNHGRNLTK